ncbi:hypothetical protein [Rhodovulum sp. MB263]|uniref:hypothetical protein n=1 Tax=Rhodovulum sp. (strain MB263) TaxID=308754 RepID=UPI0009B76F10|nr:hypothetical protein [Rhodovulum sp. MB263]ARC87858.1 hypothetical protein B5V46_04110 [Rhodovulum sp. MB263]
MIIASFPSRRAFLICERTATGWTTAGIVHDTASAERWCDGPGTAYLPVTMAEGRMIETTGRVPDHRAADLIHGGQEAASRATASERLWARGGAA